MDNFGAAGEVVIYQELRTAHVTRHSRHGGRTVLYFELNYDLPAVPTGAQFKRVSWSNLLPTLLRLNPRFVEVNEPTSPKNVSILLIVRLAKALGRRGWKTVSYAIENFDPLVRLERRLPGFARPLVPLARSVYRRSSRVIDIVAFGTQQAHDLYQQLQFLRPAVLNEARVFPSLPTACASCELSDRRDERVVFLGAFDDRKGVLLAIAAWASGAADVSTPELHVLGKGQLEAQVVKLASSMHGVQVTVDPTRAQIHAALASARVLVAPSRRTSTWREQIGLPILEALAHGCVVVTSDETGLAPWLKAHGHIVLSDSNSSEEWGRELREQVRSSRTPSEVLRDLPEEDGRDTAEKWMYA